MTESKKSIFNWNQISDELSEEQVEELKSYYQSYHKKCWAYKQALKSFKKWRLIGNSLRLVFTSDGVGVGVVVGVIRELKT